MRHIFESEQEQNIAVVRVIAYVVVVAVVAVVVVVDAATTMIQHDV